MRGRAEHGSHWLQIVIAVLVLAAIGFAAYRTLGSQPGKQDLDRSVDKITSSLGEALSLRDRERSGQATQTYVRTELERLRKDLQEVADKLAKAKPERTFLQQFQRASYFAGNAARQVRALASDAPPDSLDRAEARVRMMLDRAKKLRAAGAAGVTGRAG